MQSLKSSLLAFRVIDVFVGSNVLAKVCTGCMFFPARIDLPAPPPISTSFSKSASFHAPMVRIGP